MMYKELHNQYGHIYYEDGRHVYVDTNNGNILTSVTTLLKQYQTPFDTEYWTKKMVDNPKKPKYWGMTQQEIKDLWNKIRILGVTSGSIVHEYLETRWYNKEFPINYSAYEYLDDLNTEDFSIFHTKVKKLIGFADKFIEDHKHVIPIRPELIVGNEKLAGQIDFFGYDTEKDDYIIFDYKTDKKIDFKNEYQNFKSPLTHLDDCEFNKYSLQVNLYRKLLEPVVDVKDMHIIWFFADNDSYVKLRVKKDDKNINLIL